MEIHLHLSRQFRALDHKWGCPVDLETSDADTKSCPVLELDLPTTTFSSEAHFKMSKRCRSTPYTRIQDGDQRRNVKHQRTKTEVAGPVTQDSTLQDSAVSLAECETQPVRDEVLLTAMRGLVQDLEAPLEDSFMFDEKCLGDSRRLETSEARDETRPKLEFESVFRQLKKAAFSYIKKRYARKC